MEYVETTRVGHRLHLVSLPMQISDRCSQGYSRSKHCYNGDQQYHSCTNVSNFLDYKALGRVHRMVHPIIVAQNLIEQRISTTTVATTIELSISTRLGHKHSY
jgi:hypothetical protein